MSQRAKHPHVLLSTIVAIAAMLLTTLPGLAAAEGGEANASDLRASVEAQRADVVAGEAITVRGVVRDDGRAVGQRAVRAVLTAPDGSVLAGPVETVADPNGAYDLGFPAGATKDLVFDDRDDHSQVLAVRVTVVDDTGAEAGTTSVPVAVSSPPATLLLDNDFTSSLGWVKPGQEYPSRLIVRNLRTEAASDVTVEVPAVDGMSFTSVTPLDGAGTASIADDGTLTWDLGSVPAGSVDEPVDRTLVVTSTAETLAVDPQIVWKDLSTTATLVYGGGTVVSDSHGPKVIPPNGTYETARYGDRPFPVVPVDYTDVSYLDRNSGGDLDGVINDRSFPGSTFNLFQEMSYGQLYPDGTVPSQDVATAGWDGFDASRFHEMDVPDDSADVCFGTYEPGAVGGPGLEERIVDGVYQLPGSVEYYGSDSGETGDATVDPDGNIDDACGNIGKAVYDAAAVADPEIDYNQYDTDKDGLVDFFMMVFAGCGGNGPSQRDCEESGPYDGTDETDYTTGDGPYDNIWPHSSTLESGFVDPDTGQAGYVTDDRLTNLQGDLLFYTDDNRVETTTEDTGIPAYVRVGPYNVNPEDAIDAASVISHEYGHSLGLPDYYGTQLAEFYGTWNLMASDYSQHMDLNGRQELGWVIPKEIPADADGEEVSMVEAKTDINEIQWREPDGTMYTLSGPDVHNGDAWTAPLPRRLLLEEELVDNGASPTHVWFSGAGNDFGCVPNPTAHSLDIPLDLLEDVEPGTPVEVRFASYWDIEYEWDYGFLLATTNGGDDYSSVANDEGYTIPGDGAGENPNDVACLDQHGNGLTGNSAAWEDGDATGDEQANPVPATEFLPTTWDLSAYAGEATTLRFAYFTDVAVARPGWFIDDFEVVVDGDVVYSNDFEGGPNDGVVNTGCDGAIETGPCTAGWQYITGGQESTADHAYYVELRDRAGFDFDAHGQSDRGPIDWDPGVSLGYTDESRGYGNITAIYRPNQHVLDANPTPYSGGGTGDVAFTPDLTDAAWQPDSDPFSDFGDGHVDNYADVDRPDLLWRLDHQCLEMDVTSMSGQEHGPSTLPADLAATVAFTRGEGCAERDYGYGNVANTSPDAVLQFKSGDNRVRQGVPVTFDASGSSDTTTPRSGLAYSWDFDGDGTEDAAGETVQHTFDELGSQEVTLTVTDAEGAAGTDAATIEVVDDKDATIRLAGVDRIDTAIQLSRLSYPEGADVAILAQSRDYPDALAAATLAGELGAPVLLNPTDALDVRVAAELQRLGVSTVVVTGGPAAISTDVLGELESLDLQVQRIGGVDRVETAALIADEVVGHGGEVDTVVVARSYEFADALASGNVGISLRAPILLTGQDELRPETLAALLALSPSRVIVAGGSAAISEDVFDAIVEAGFAAERVGGDTRVDTALLLAGIAGENGAGVEPTVLANAFNFPDALGAAPAAAALGGRMLTVHPDGASADRNQAVLEELGQDADTVDTVYVAGGQNAIDPSLDAATTAAITTDAEAGLPDDPLPVHED